MVGGGEGARVELSVSSSTPALSPHGLRDKSLAARWTTLGRAPQLLLDRVQEKKGCRSESRVLGARAVSGLQAFLSEHLGGSGCKVGMS